jgi:hypothetical protein
LKKKNRITLADYLRANRMASRELEQEVRGAGFHAMHKVHKSAKQYVRKLKHKKRLDEE